MSVLENITDLRNTLVGLSKRPVQSFVCLFSIGMVEEFKREILETGCVETSSQITFPFAYGGVVYSVSDQLSGQDLVLKCVLDQAK